MAPESEPPEDPEAFRKRVEALRSRIDARAPQRAASKDELAPNSGFGPSISLAMKVGSEFVAAIIVGAALGWGLDWLLHTKPLFTILFFLIGVAAGVVNVIRSTSPKGANLDRDSRLSHGKADAKDVPRDSPRGGKS